MRPHRSSDEQQSAKLRDDAHWRVLSLIEAEPELSQRQLSERLGVSLGKTNYLLRALLSKGLVKAENFRRSDNKLAYLYLLTPEGMAEKLRLTRAYLARKESEYQALKQEIDAVRNELAKAGGMQ